MEKWFNKHFAMNRKELQGLSFLTIAIIGLWFLPTIYSWLRPIEESSEFELKVKEIEDFLAANESETSSSAITALSTNSEAGEPVSEYFIFDPNKLTVDEGRRLGLSDYQIRMILNYVSKGGKFYRKEDFAKIYAINESDFQRLYPYIEIDESLAVRPPKELSEPSASTMPHSDQQVTFKNTIAKELLIELNTTDSISLQDLRGIGPVFASRIIRFRNLLGGFHNKAQLLNVYGMDEERFQGIEKNIFVDSVKIKKINVNSADYRQLLKHPYINPKQANVIVQYRNQHGNYERPEDLLNIELLNEEFLRKIAPYLAFNDD